MLGTAVLFNRFSKFNSTLKDDFLKRTKANVRILAKKSMLRYSGFLQFNAWKVWPNLKNQSNKMVYDKCNII